ncbi:hypothetical protein C8J57DRAFT_1711651 [Mycena rebaudengoi]|nr:hypothetical protein C8J57DRAFT_1711651 [Mycena rebaudengoi]
MAGGLGVCLCALLVRKEMSFLAVRRCWRGLGSARPARCAYGRAHATRHRGCWSGSGWRMSCARSHLLQADGWAGVMLVAAFVAAIIALLVAGRHQLRPQLAQLGPTAFLNPVAKTWLVAGRFDDGFHTYVLEQNKWIFPFVPPSFRSLPLVCSVPFFLIIAPYDQHTYITSPLASITLRVLLYFAAAFYLIMNVAVGGTNGWFPDGPEKPWLDAAPRDFLQAKDLWYPSWPQDIERPAMVIDWVKIWEKCGS